MHASRDMQPVKVFLFAASLRKDSVNARLIALLERVLTERGATVDHASMRDFDCPSYDQDAEAAGEMPAGAQRLRERLLENDAFMISAPEYNGSMPGILKNVIDWTSRFRPQPFNGKQAFLLSASPSMAGGNRGLWALRVPLEHLGARVYPDMFSLAQAHTAFNDDGRIANDMLQQRLESVTGCFLEIVEATKHYKDIKKQWVEFLGERPDASTDRVETAPLHVS
ncbi:MAG TPA: NAD(P)H-dependent oxidoreductase [Thermoanaerobaculia bacterium]|nr:NAD(P)H-dependent oxidoreductase [Thermoanaerobaculia bacterium]